MSGHLHTWFPGYGPSFETFTDIGGDLFGQTKYSVDWRERTLRTNFHIFLSFVAIQLLVVSWLAGTGEERFAHLHLVMDTANAISSLMLALFLLAEQTRLPVKVHRYLAIAFCFGAATELIHSLVGIEWSGWMGWVREHAEMLRPATWPPCSYVLPISLLWVHWLIRRGGALSPPHFALGVLILTVGLYGYSFSLPRYLDTGFLGIQRPAQVPLLFVLLAVIIVYWRRRREHPFFQGVALMGGLMFLSDFSMIYSTSPHEKFTMMTHMGKFLAYTLLHVVQMRVAAVDSQARTQAEQSLEMEKRHLAKVLGELRVAAVAFEAQCGMVVTGPSGLVQRVNSSFSRLSGFAAKEVLGRKLFTFDGVVAAAKKPAGKASARPDRASAGYFLSLGMMTDGDRLDDIEVALQEGMAYACVMRCYRQDGSAYWNDFSLSPVKDRRGQVTHFIGICVDITARKQVEDALRDSDAKLQLALESSSAAIWEWHVADDRLILGGHWKDILGCDQQDLPRSSAAWQAYLLPEEIPMIRAGLMEHLQGHVPIWRVEHRVRRRDGAIVWVGIRGKVTERNGLGKAERALGIVLDVTERRQAEDARERNRETLVREVHHRIKNNLQGVAGLLQRELGQFLELDPRLETAISQVHVIASVHGLQGKAIDESISLVACVTDIARSVGNLVQKTVTMVTSDNWPMDTRVVIEPSESVPIALVVNELLLNAVKHAPPLAEGPAVSISWEAGEVVVAVMNQARSELAFDFSENRGLGTGLTLVRSMLPPEGAYLSYVFAKGGRVEARLTLRWPIINTMAGGAHGQDTGG